MKPILPSFSQQQNARPHTVLMYDLLNFYITKPYARQQSGNAASEIISKWYNPCQLFIDIAGMTVYIVFELNIQNGETG